MKIDSIRCQICNRYYDLTLEYTNVRLCPKCERGLEALVEANRSDSIEPESL